MKLSSKCYFGSSSSYKNKSIQPVANQKCIPLLAYFYFRSSEDCLSFSNYYRTTSITYLSSYIIYLFYVGHVPSLLIYCKFRDFT